MLYALLYTPPARCAFGFVSDPEVRIRDNAYDSEHYQRTRQGDIAADDCTDNYLFVAEATHYITSALSISRTNLGSANVCE